MTTVEEIRQIADSKYFATRRWLLIKAAAEIESLQKDSANAYDALSKAQQERDEFRRQNEALQKELRHWRNEKFEQAVLAANVELKRQNAELELRLLDVVAEYESKMIDIHKQNAELQKELVFRKDEISHLNNQRHELNDTVADLRRQNAALASALRDVLINIEKEVKEALAAQPEGGAK